MPCLVGCLALAFPRLAVLLVWLFGGAYLERAYEHWYWPVLGFFFFPMTTLGFAYASNSVGPAGEVTSLGWLLVGLSFAVDIGLIGRGHSGARRWREER
jgi:hypothetical protein